MADLAQIQHYNRQLEALHRRFENRLKDENGACMTRIAELQNELERKSAALRDSERRLFPMRSSDDETSSVQACLQSVKYAPSSRCISWEHIRLIFTTCCVCNHIAL